MLTTKMLTTLKKTMNLKKHYLLIKTTLVVFITLLLSACGVKKYIPEGELLYSGAKLEVTSDTVIKNIGQLQNQLQKVLQPQPNKKFMGMPLGLYYYYKNQKKHPGFINKWLYKKHGEKPVYQSDIKNLEIKDILLNQLENQGFFYSNVSSNWKINKKKKRAFITYKVVVPLPYRLAKYQLDTLPQPIYKEIQDYVANTTFEKGMRFNLDSLKTERNRIDKTLKKKGYYNFNPNFLIFETDTSQYSNKQFNLYLKLKENVPKKAIVPYTINQVNIFTNYDIETNNPVQLDTVRFNDKNFISTDNFFKPKRLDPFIKLAKNTFYNPLTSQNTSHRLSTIGAYKFVNIQYEQLDTILPNDSIGKLAANIYLSPLNKMAIRASLEAVTKSNNFTGPKFGVTFSNRNLFKGGELLNINANTGYEFQIAKGNREGLSSLQLGLKTDLIFPRVLFPIKIDYNYFKYAIPKTKINLGVDYLNRNKMYTLLSGTAQFGYKWNANRFITHDIIPISVNYTKLSDTSSEFEQLLAENLFLKRSFEQQFISGLLYSFTYNGMVDTQKMHQFYINTTFDIAGNSLSLFDKNTPNEADTFLELAYAQYAKMDLDLRYHLKINQNNTIATRLFAGYGLAYGNSNVMPYTKQYFSGGPYSVRAFRIRSLGPGTYNENDANANTARFLDLTGNIRLEANIEYRFPLFSFFKGAVFADAGNIWNSKTIDAFNGKGKFSSNFINELGMGAGLGLRIDVQGFVLRFDFASPFHDPGLPKGEQWDFKINETVFNFAIGYPF